MNIFLLTVKSIVKLRIKMNMCVVMSFYNEWIFGNFTVNSFKMKILTVWRYVWNLELKFKYILSACCWAMEYMRTAQYELVGNEVDWNIQQTMYLHMEVYKAKWYNINAVLIEVMLLCYTDLHITLSNYLG